MKRKEKRKGTLVTIVFLGLLMIALNCTDSCYKDEANYADAGNAPSTPTTTETGSSSDGCRVGDVYYQVEMVHPDRPCLACSYLDDNISIGWVPLVDGAPCDDGKFCTGEGTCDRGRCIFEGNPCPEEAPYCLESYGGVCTDQPYGDDDDVSSDDDTVNDDDDLVFDDDDCWSCVGTIECIYLLGEGYGCQDNCCVLLGDDDDTIQDDDDIIADDDDTVDDDDVV